MKVYKIWIGMRSSAKALFFCCTNLTNGISACTRCNLPGSKNSSFISVIEFNIVPNHIKIPFV
ncbi:hypothetical protein RUMLAC_00625 [[Ruminococcus] lactaris ATCC 29176]|uniref:Uncharacterized protein n=2 Tax=[Ruminococcus] lactaris ATCC 29176 TaxID=471875 RepID=B5CMF0_9FIRM|nr:hypothetical protein RUMLAC_02293 [[Ruminococcus] lactaris ATCC 29176]EDY33560.1 hypothetical protein RUMLAC_00625 [[Ruminococcus] lactaris ATCC 29176]